VPDRVSEDERSEDVNGACSDNRSKADRMTPRLLSDASMIGVFSTVVVQKRLEYRRLENARRITGRRLQKIDSAKECASPGAN